MTRLRLTQILPAPILLFLFSLTAQASDPLALALPKKEIILQEEGEIPVEDFRQGFTGEIFFSSDARISDSLRPGTCITSDDTPYKFHNILQASRYFEKRSYHPLVILPTDRADATISTKKKGHYAAKTICLRGWINSDNIRINLRNIFSPKYALLRDKIDFTGSHFANITMDYLDFSGLDLTGSIFSQAEIKSANFLNTNLQKTIFEETTIRWSDMTGADFSQAIIARPQGNHFTVDTKLDKAIFREAKLSAGGVIINDYFTSFFIKTSLVKADFTNARAHNVLFQKCDLNYARFLGVDLTATVFKESQVATILRSEKEYTDLTTGNVALPKKSRVFREGMVLPAEQFADSFSGHLFFTSAQGLESIGSGQCMAAEEGHLLRFRDVLQASRYLSDNAKQQLRVVYLPKAGGSEHAIQVKGDYFETRSYCLGGLYKLTAIELLLQHLFHKDRVNTTERIRQTDLGNSYWAGMTLTGADFSQLDLGYSTFDRMKFIDCYFRGTNFTGSKFTKSALIGADFFNFACLSNLEFLECDCSETDFSGTNLSTTSFRSTKLRKCDFSAKGVAATFDKSNLAQSRLPRPVLLKAYATDARLNLRQRLRCKLYHVLAKFS